VIGIIDYGMGNLRSVRNAVAHLEGGDAELVASAEEARRADRLILPGVGAFGAAMRRLEERDLVTAIPELVREGRPLLGICLGMQLLADTSSEHGEHAGLGLISGQVELLPVAPLRIPHVGWNSLEVRDSTPLLDGLDPDPSFYFVHSFEFTPSDPAHVTATTEYGRPVVAVVENGAVMGTQFHPEKSQAAGLRVLANFLAMDPC